jgi:hypothetical protein
MRREEGGRRRRPDPEKEEGVDLKSRGERGGEEGTAQIHEESSLPRRNPPSSSIAPVAEGRQSRRGSRREGEPRLAGSAAALSLGAMAVTGAQREGARGGEKGERAPTSAQRSRSQSECAAAERARRAWLRVKEERRRAGAWERGCGL